MSEVAKRDGIGGAGLARNRSPLDQETADAIGVRWRGGPLVSPLSPRLPPVGEIGRVRVRRGDGRHRPRSEAA